MSAEETARPPRDRARLGGARRAAGLVLVNLVGIGLLFALLEGCSSLLFIANEVVRTPGVPEHNHAEHDELLGWVNVPNAHLPDFYGPGVGVRINAQRFRADQEFPPSVPAGKLRIICSGDSFTFGYGVGDEDTWCQRLETLDPRVEAVNMGLGGYGVDQAYLWYMRDGTKLDHDVLLFAFLTDDFNRMRSDRFMGYGKPLLELQGDSLVVTNLPVPETSWLSHQRALHGETIARLNVVRLARKLLGLDRAAAPAAENDPETDQLRAVVAQIFAELKHANDVKGSRLVLVFLPGAWDYMGQDAETEPWRSFVRQEAARQGITVVDLVEELRRVPPTEVERLYAPNAHFSVAGNVWAAGVLHDRISALLLEMGGYGRR